MEQKNRYYGLNEAEVLQSRKEHGVNILTPPEKESLWSKFLEKFEDPLIRILLVAGLLSIGISCYEFLGLGHAWTVFFEPIGIFVAILLATGLSFYFELIADKEFSILNQVNDDEPVKVIRCGNTIEIPKKDVVVGDILIISTGDEVPADAELLEAISLNIDESSLTGEPVCAKTTNPADFDNEATFPSNHVMRGTKVMEGHGICRVFAVGDKTENGKVFEAAQIDDSVKTPLNEQLDGLSDLITNLSYLFAGLVIIGRLLVFFDWNWLALTLLIPTALFFYLVIKKFEDFSRAKCIITIVSFFAVLMAMVLGLFQHLHPAAEIADLLTYTMQTLMIAVTLIVVAVPEGLPMAVTLSLAYSMRRMLKTNNLVRKMHACETMGATTVICTDKTGTLTQNKMTVVDHYGDDEKLMANAMSLCSDAEFDTEANTAVGEPTEAALVNYAEVVGVSKNVQKNELVRIGEVPFDSGRKMMSTVHKAVDGTLIQFTKGAPDEVLKRCTKALVGGVEVDMTEAIRAEILAANKAMADKALRVLSAAKKSLTAEPAVYEPEAVECDLCFIGLVGMIDPVRPEVKPAIDECRSAGIRPIMITGDHKDTAVAIATELGIITDPSQAITGAELNEISDEEFETAVEKYSVYARVQPEHKTRIVNAWRGAGYVTAMTGDGVNDAPSIKNADIGVGMGITGTDVTKNVADMILADDNFATIVSAVGEGRRIYDNIRKAIQFLLASNLSEVLSIFAATLLGFTIFQPVHLLWINLITDCFPALALGMEKAESNVMERKPRDSKEGIFANGLGFAVAYQGAIVTVITIISYLIGRYWLAVEYHAEAIASGLYSAEMLGSSMAFLTLSMCEIFHAFNMRSLHGSIFTIKGQNKWLWGAGVLSFILTTVVVEIDFLCQAFELAHLNMMEYGIALGLSILIIPIVEFVKIFHRRIDKNKEEKAKA